MDKLRAAAQTRRPPMDVKGAAAYTSFAEGYLNKLRCTGGGPIFIKRAGAVRYDPDDLDIWLASLKRKSTSDMMEVAS
jgi:hypothetical protein